MWELRGNSFINEAYEASLSLMLLFSLSQSVPLLDPYQPLSPAQKDIQRHSTLQLLQRSLQIPESETELQETLTLIQELNSLQIVLIQTEEQQREFKAENETLVESRWPRFYECAATHCSLCNYPLFKGGQRWEDGSWDDRSFYIFNVNRLKQKICHIGTINSENEHKTDQVTAVVVCWISYKQLHRVVQYSDKEPMFF